MGKPNPQNLTPWKKGQSGNPKGKPPTKHIEQRFQKFLAEVARSKDGEELERLEVVMRAMFAKAAKGDTRAANLLMDRAFGKAKQEIEYSEKRHSLDNVDDVESAEEAEKLYNEAKK